MSISHTGRVANPTDVLMLQREGVNREEMVVREIGEMNSMTALFPVAPQRCGRINGPSQTLRRAQKLVR